MKTSRPFLLILLTVAVLGLAIFNLARAIQTVQLWKTLTVVLSVSPAYPLVSGLAWGLIGLGLALGLWRGWPNARLGALPIGLAYSLYTWIDRLALPGYAGRNLNWPFWAVINLLSLAGLAWIVSRRRVKSFFGDAHEQPLSGPFALDRTAGPGDQPQDPPAA